MANCSILTFKVAAGAPAYCIAKPKSAIPRLDLLDAICTTSATLMAFCAISPCFRFQILRALLTTSEVVAKSSPLATAAVITDGITPTT